MSTPRDNVIGMRTYKTGSDEAKAAAVDNGPRMPIERDRCGDRVNRPDHVLPREYNIFPCTKPKGHDGIHACLQSDTSCVATWLLGGEDPPPDPRPLAA